MYCRHAITNKIYLLNEWEGRTGKYFSPGKDLRTDRNLSTSGGLFFSSTFEAGRGGGLNREGALI